MHAAEQEQCPINSTKRLIFLRSIFSTIWLNETSLADLLVACVAGKPKGAFWD